MGNPFLTSVKGRGAPRIISVEAISRQPGISTTKQQNQGMILSIGDIPFEWTLGLSGGYWYPSLLSRWAIAYLGKDTIGFLFVRYRYKLSPLGLLHPIYSLGASLLVDIPSRNHGLLEHSPSHVWRLAGSFTLPGQSWLCLKLGPMK